MTERAKKIARMAENAFSSHEITVKCFEENALEAFNWFFKNYKGDL